MWFLFGFLVGVVFCIFILLAVIFFREPIEQYLPVIESKIPKKRPKGFIVEPQSREDEVREDIINQNNKKGLDTPLKDLL